ncbi:alkene reductase [Streptomyces spectabilis]|uniref:Alkene reductase n=1 Tax=Streptomyces spectabilis TaxID=68270 RepID=A0A5P2XD16_STRST|nr:alkene reductase [Streptomyces spectabilis]MBB5104298.1 N-ethylmaleimide reductase [Streptomyces spectabilis]MCI3905343.1 alkene reductase [Streptomyces spectabilis]QEV62341.1 alkene reductase [Streptomyces spectabilis]GGU99062.1 alkene reductase [Streptomyces spectabilis]
MTQNTLLTPYAAPFGHLPNRMVMAPMTRFRGEEDGTPQPIVADYYAQRASAGLIVTEGIWPSSRGQSGWRIPGLETAAHVAGWRRVTEAVHAAGGRIYAQLMHGGRHGHPLSRIDGDAPAAPSVVVSPELVHVRDGGKAEPVTPRVMTVDDIRTAVDDHVAAARNAIEAGFDGVELHGANSYLIHQFLADNTNLRDDAYGRGSMENRIRFAVEVVRAVADAIGAERLGLRLSPGNPQFGMYEADPGPVYRALLDEIDGLGLAYLHLTDNDRYPALDDLRPHWSGTLIANVGENGDPTTKEAGEAVVADGRADLVSYGRAFLTTPDLPHRFAVGAPPNDLDAAHLYTNGAEGYTDYPALGARELQTSTST